MKKGDTQLYMWFNSCIAGAWTFMPRNFNILEHNFRLNTSAYLIAYRMRVDPISDLQGGRYFISGVTRSRRWFPIEANEFIAIQRFKIEK